MSPNKDSFSLRERREAVEIRNQEMCDMAISIVNECFQGGFKMFEGWS